MAGLDLRKGDCLAILRTLPDDSVDCVLTDPPYGSGGLFLGSRQQTTRIKYQVEGTEKVYPEFFGDAKDQRSWLAWAQLWLSQCWRVARDGAPLLIFSGWRQLPTVADAVQAGGWTCEAYLPGINRHAAPKKAGSDSSASLLFLPVKGAFWRLTSVASPAVFRMLWSGTNST